MLVELHLLQNFSPSCLNRDEANAPKDCEFGGHRRARISSQCIKRAIRTQFKQGMIPTEDLATRSKRLVGGIAQRLAERGHGEVESSKVTVAGLGGLGVLCAPDRKTGITETYYLVFAHPRELAGLAHVCHKNWDALAEAYEKAWAGKERAPLPDDARKAVPSTVRKELAKALDGGKAVDIALFGRMIADLPEGYKDAACQVAHAISTHKVSTEFDFYTAVDELKPREESQGAGMMGSIEFNSACYYRYSALDMEQLKQNLAGKPLKDATEDERRDVTEFAQRVLSAYLRASVTAVPTGKQNSMAAHNPPDAILAVVRDSGAPMSLANAFLVPVRSTSDQGLVLASAEAMDSYWAKLAGVYGEAPVRARPLCLVGDAELPALGDQRVPSFQALLQTVSEAIRRG